MKKVLFGALVLAVAAVFAGCEKKDKGNVVTGISLNYSEATLTEGGSIRLKATLEPEGVTGEITWATSDTTVATVTEKGYVEAVGLGTANITAACGEYKAVCAVSVKSFLETINFSGAILWSEDTTYAGGVVDTIEASSGAKYYAYKSLGELWIMSDGFYVSNSGYLDGTTQGAVVKILAPFYYATAYLNKAERGTVFTLGQWIVSDNAEYAGKAHVGEPGSLNEALFLQYMEAFVDGLNTATSEAEQSAAYQNLLAAGDSAFSGAIMDQYAYHTTSEGYSSDGYYGQYMPNGLITKADFSLNTNYSASDYMCGLDYSFITFKPIDNDNYYWGCNWEVGESSISWADKQIHYGDVIEYSFGEKPASEAPKYEPINAPVLTIDCPEVAARIKAQLEGKQITTLRVK